VKVFPSANDINLGSTGSGNIVTEANVSALTLSLPPRNFVISGFDISRIDESQVQFTAGKAFIGGRYVETDDSITYSLDPAPATDAVNQVYFFLTAVLSGADVVSLQFENSNVSHQAPPATPGSLSVMLGVASTNGVGEMQNDDDVRNSKINLGGGVFSGTYVGTGPGVSTVEILDVALPFTPSFIYISGEAQAGGSSVVACSGVLPAGPRAVASSGTNLVGSMYSCGWAMVEDGLLGYGTNYTAEIDGADLGECAADSWATDSVTVTGARVGDTVMVGGNVFLANNTAGTVPGSLLEALGTGFVYYTPAGYVSDYEGTDNDYEIYKGPLGRGIGGVGSSPILVSAVVADNDTVLWGMYNSRGTFTPGTSPGVVTVISAWDFARGTRLYIDNLNPPASPEIRPLPTPTGFRVSRSPDGIGGSGDTLNTLDRRYFYWAFGA